MSKYLVETFYTCSFKVKHYLDKVNQTELDGLEQRDDGEFEVIDIKIDSRKTKSLEKKSSSKSDTSISEVKLDKGANVLENKNLNKNNKFLKNVDEEACFFIFGFSALRSDAEDSRSALSSS